MRTTRVAYRFNSRKTRPAGRAKRSRTRVTRHAATAATAAPRWVVEFSATSARFERMPTRQRAGGAAPRFWGRHLRRCGRSARLRGGTLAAKPEAVNVSGGSTFTAAAGTRRLGTPPASMQRPRTLRGSRPRAAVPGALRIRGRRLHRRCARAQRWRRPRHRRSRLPHDRVGPRSPLALACPQSKRYALR